MSHDCDVNGKDAVKKTGTLLTEKAMKWIGEDEDKPFFLYFPTTNIHHPFTPSPRFKGTSQCGLYGDFIHELDWKPQPASASSADAVS